jgi:asparagine synthase (glutamine-hydrolysing)
MCGICGWVDWDGGAEAPVVRRMTERLHHRGPDGAGLWSDPLNTAVLGHRRLAVLDTSDLAEQPMVDPSGNVLVYNGEVYSFPELRSDLEAAGRPIRSTGDTEVVLASLCQWGEQAFERFNGMFALALWQPAGQRLVLARDRMGIKPLFVAVLPRGLAFASEIPALLSNPAVSRELDSDAVARWLQQGFPTGRNTLFKGVMRVPPGHLLIAEDGGIRIDAWYDLLDRVHPQHDISTSEASEELEELLLDAVQLRLISDVPLGTFLSGGVDSTAVVAAAARSGARPEALTVQFSGGVDESALARRTASAFGLSHQIERCSPIEMLEVFAAWYRIAGDPIADPSLAPPG